MKTKSQLDETEEGCNRIAELARAVGLLHDKPIENVIARLHSWALATTGASINCLRIDDVEYSWDTKPRLQKNGAAIGRVYAQRRGELTRDIGAYKIAGDGRVLQLPAAVRAILPGGETAIDAVDAEGG